MLKKWFQHIGPGTLVAAAFIGPGTVTLCTLAGVGFGMQLLWAMLLSTVATVILQEMTARLGVVTQKELSEVVREAVRTPLLRQLLTVLILSAIVVGNAAYEAGNISGGILGLEVLLGRWVLEFDTVSVNMLSVLIGLLAFTLLYIGNYRFLERALVSLVLLMSISFVVTALLTQPDLVALLQGLLVPQVPEKSLLTLIGLIGTTVVPYNLFLHASLAREKWKTPEQLPLARRDTLLSIGLGGVVSMSIIISAAAIPAQEVHNAVDLAESLVPLYGEFARYFLAVGLFAAGITSAITAPLAAAYVAKGCLGWESGLKTKRFRAVWMVILVVGLGFSAVGIKPIKIIKFAQIANGMLLPLIVGTLLWVMNKKTVLGAFGNTRIQNTVGVLLFAVSVFLGLKSILAVLGMV
mgnify:CR=1 FL=1